MCTFRCTSDVHSGGREGICKVGGGGRMKESVDLVSRMEEGRCHNIIAGYIYIYMYVFCKHIHTYIQINSYVRTCVYTHKRMYALANVHFPLCL